MVKAATKGGKKGKAKVTLKMDKGVVDNFDDDFGGGDYDDFMQGPTGFLLFLTGEVYW